MRKLTPEELSDFSGEWDGRASPFYIAIINLQKGEGVGISKEEWNMYRTPSRICRYIEKKFPVKYTCIKHRDKSGWKVIRVK